MSDLSGAISSHEAVEEAHSVPFAPGVPQNPLRAAKKMVADKVAADKRTRLSWSSRTDYRTPGDAVQPPHPVIQERAKILGKLDKRLAFMGPFFGYWIQNGNVLKGNGLPVRLSEVPEKVKNIWIDSITRLPVQGEDFPLRETLSAALAVWRQQAVQADPLMCPICFASNGDPVAFSAHLYKAHRSELAEAAGDEEGPAPVEAQAQPKKASKAAQI